MVAGILQKEERGGYVMISPPVFKRGLIVILFAVNISLSAFLLFQIQPMIGKFILPWFGGTPAVWSTAMLFFQALLTGGYAYAYWLVKRTRQRWIHSVLLAVTLALLAALGAVWRSPITPSADWRPNDVRFPVGSIFVILSVSVGLPYFVLASNGPLMQAWFSRLQPGFSYARLYALSNAGSLCGLLAYPILVEPNLSLQQQGWSWAVGFMAFALVSFAIMNRLKAVRLSFHAALETTEKPSASLNLLWLTLSGIASLFLIAVTNQISQEVAVIPFLWALPLAIYLLTFILAFSDSRWYDRRLFALAFSLASLALLWVFMRAGDLNVVVQISVYCLLLFSACMICHGELYQLRPPAGRLTSFYLMVSLGGAAGGVFVNFLAPLIFNGYWEFYLGWLMSAVILIVRLLPAWKDSHTLQTRTMLFSFPLSVTLLWAGLNPGGGYLMAERNFYGVIRVQEREDGALAMIHGVTIHGIQYPGQPHLATTYYAEDSGVGLLLRSHPKRGEGLRVGVLGLGAGTLAVYAEPGDSYRYYEINEIVIRLAEGEGGYFTFLNDSAAASEIIPGDARISLENELRSGGAQNFDVLVLDTFSSDSIPVHLVTREAFSIYLQHLSAKGVIAAHISNRHLDLQPVFWKQAQEFGLNIIRVDNGAANIGEFPSVWVLLSKDPAVLALPPLGERAQTYDGYSTNIPLWTDDYSNLFQILK
ncbi:MAG: ferrichrome ABC transporter permease [Chloroflexi bacterium]|nr:ferrichrome ABC transporter permease [Chloroflexota bacterium]